MDSNRESPTICHFLLHTNFSLTVRTWLQRQKSHVLYVELEPFLIWKGVTKINSGLCDALRSLSRILALGRIRTTSCRPSLRQRDMPWLRLSVLHHVKVTGITVGSRWQESTDSLWRDMDHYLQCSTDAISANGILVHLKSWLKFPLYHPFPFI